MDRVRCGIIGVGGMGSGHVRIIPSLEEVELTAVSDANNEVCQSVASKAGVPGFNDYKELLDSGLVDMVLIATPHYFHPPIAIDAFDRGIHVLSEKPIAVTVSQAGNMIAAAKRSGKQFGVMYQMRSEAVNQAVHKVIQDGGLGEIYRTALIMGWYRSQAYYDSGGWRATWAGEGGGVLINQAPHMLDLFTWLAGLPSRITAQTRTRLHDIEVEDEAFAMLEYANGAHGYLYASTTEAPGQDRIEICGDMGKLVLHGGKATYWKLDSSIKEFTRSSTEMWSGPKAREVEVEIVPREQGHGAITRNFARSILYGEPLIAPGEEGLNAVEMIDGIILSGKTGEPVSVPVDRPRYDRLIEELKAGSREKASVKEQRVTDPKFA
ncbi:MAG TPA: Gfo/Idh/MocA family oxidoreductase [Armatimonadota bacterium]|nr:Gfo/Idh/MocA family oxidoreductase [Armatimonadota bacterium]